MPRARIRVQNAAFNYSPGFASGNDAALLPLGAIVEVTGSSLAVSNSAWIPVRILSDLSVLVPHFMAAGDPRPRTSPSALRAGTVGWVNQRSVEVLPEPKIAYSPPPPPKPSRMHGVVAASLGAVALAFGAAMSQTAKTRFR